MNRVMYSTVKQHLSIFFNLRGLNITKKKTTQLLSVDYEKNYENFIRNFFPGLLGLAYVMVSLRHAPYTSIKMTFCVFPCKL